MNKSNTIFSKSIPGVKGVRVPKSDVPEIKLESIIDKNYLRQCPPKFPEISESEIVRHYTNSILYAYCIYYNLCATNITGTLCTHSVPRCMYN